MKTNKKRHSYWFELSITAVICWVLPIFIVCSMAGMVLNWSYNRNLHRSARAEARSAMRQMEIRLNFVIEDSKSVSYEGEVERAYQVYLQNSDQAELEKTLTNYLNYKFSRNAFYRSVYISFSDPSLDILPYYTAPGVSDSEKTLPAVQEISVRQDSDITFTMVEDRLYMIRNLQDADSQNDAVLVSELEMAELLQSVYGLSVNQNLEVTLDGNPVFLYSLDENEIAPWTAQYTESAQVDGHELVSHGQVTGLNIWNTVPLLKWSVLIVVALGVPVLLVITLQFNRNISHPISELMKANSRIINGERGYQISRKAPNLEMELLYRDFNAMSGELKNQFQQLYEEQQALQQAKIRALQSQINPHFLNNTLEVINWEARLSDNERVCSMIEALSTMLDAAISRDGRSQVLLSEEMKYVEAYLYITKERLGDRLTITRQIQPEALSCTVPLLILQPIMENAVEYDLSRSGGSLDLSICLRGQRLHLEVLHDGTISEEGWQKIQAGLSGQESGDAVIGRSVGIRNVVNRLKLLYGEDYYLEIRRSTPGKILAVIDLPMTAATFLAQN